MTLAYADPVAIDTTRRFRMVWWGCAVILFSIIIGQRFGYTVVPDPDFPSEVPLAIPFVYAALLLMFLSGRVFVHMTRLALYLFSMSALIFTLVLDPKPFGVFSLFYIIICYLPFIFVCPATEDEYKQILRLFNNFMVIIATVTLAQFVYYTVGENEPIDRLGMVIPKQFLLQGFNTKAQVSFDIQVGRANGEFFVEPSFVSQFLALSVLIELIWFKRNWRMALYGLGIVASLSGTGVMLLLIFGSVLLIQKKQYHWLLAGIVVIVFLQAQPADSPLGFFANRSSELSTEEGSSGFMRFVGPFIAVPYSLGIGDIVPWLVGNGPGSSKDVIKDLWFEVNPLASTKVLVEYGLLGLLPFMVFLIHTMMMQKFSYVFAAGMFFMYHMLSGSLAQPHTVFLFLVLAVMFTPMTEADRLTAERGSQ